MHIGIVGNFPNRWNSVFFGIVYNVSIYKIRGIDVSQ